MNKLDEMKQIARENRALWNRLENLHKAIIELIDGARTDYNLSKDKAAETIKTLVQRAETSGEIRKKLLLAEADKLRAEQEQSGISPEIEKAYQESMKEYAETFKEAQAAQAQIVDLYNQIKAEMDEIRKAAFADGKDPGLVQNGIKSMEREYKTFISEVSYES